MKKSAAILGVLSVLSLVVTFSGCKQQINVGDGSDQPYQPQTKVTATFISPLNPDGVAKIAIEGLVTNKSARVAASNISGKLEDGDIILNLKGMQDNETKTFFLEANATFLKYKITGTLTGTVLSNVQIVVSVQTKDGSYTDYPAVKAKEESVEVTDQPATVPPQYGVVVENNDNASISGIWKIESEGGFKFSENVYYTVLKHEDNGIELTRVGSMAEPVSRSDGVGGETIVTKNGDFYISTWSDSDNRRRVDYSMKGVVEGKNMYFLSKKERNMNPENYTDANNYYTDADVFFMNLEVEKGIITPSSFVRIPSEHNLVILKESGMTENELKKRLGSIKHSADIVEISENDSDGYIAYFRFAFYGNDMFQKMEMKIVGGKLEITPFASLNRVIASSLKEAKTFTTTISEQKVVLVK